MAAAARLLEVIQDLEQAHHTLEHEEEEESGAGSATPCP